MNILMVAYKIEANKGSEDGIGYHFCAAMAKKTNRLTVITRRNNVDKLRNDPAFKNVTLISIDVPKYLGFFKRGERGIILYYYMWQICVGLFVRKLTREQNFDAIYQVTFASSWAAHFLRSKRTPIIWGPLLNHYAVPYDYWFGGPISFIRKELTRRFAKRLFWYTDPFLRHSVTSSKTVFWGCENIPHPFTKYPEKNKYLISAGSPFPPVTSKNIDDIFDVLFVGRFVDLKGCITALKAYGEFVAQLPTEQQKRTNLRMIGAGPLQKKLEALAFNIRQRTKTQITIEPWMPQSSLQNTYEKADLFLFPSFEGQGLVVAEALAQGCPVLCLKDTGPSFIASNAGTAVARDNYSLTHQQLVASLKKLSGVYWDHPDRYQDLIRSSLERAEQLSWDRKIDTLLEARHA